MKTTDKYRPAANIILLLLFAFSAFIAGCDITDPMDGIRAILNMKERTTTVSVVFMDAATNEPVGFDSNMEVRVTFNGPDGDKIIDLLNRPKLSLAASSGFLSFAVSDELQPTPDNPVRFTIDVEADGFLPVSRNVFIAEQGNTPLEVRMINEDNLPEGVSVVRNLRIGEVSPGGVTNDEISFGTDSEGNVDNRSTGKRILDNEPPEPPVSAMVPGIHVSIDEGTTITDDEGTVLSGELTAEINYYSPFFWLPGFATGVVNGTVDNYIFARQGLVKMVITDENGKVARYFDPDIRTSFTYREYFGADEETVPAWGSDQNWPASWNFIDNEPVKEVESAFGRGMRETTVLASVFHRWQKIAYHIPACQVGLEMQIQGTSLPVFGEIRNAATFDIIDEVQSRINRNQSGGVTDHYMKLYYMPRDMESVIDFHNMNGTLMGQVTVPDLCSVSPVNVSLDSPELTVTFRGKGVCENNDEIEVRPNMPVNIRFSTGTWRYAGRMQNGELVQTLPEPGVYTFGAYVEGRFQIYEIDLSNASDGDVVEREIDLPADVCDSL